MKHFWNLLIVIVLAPGQTISTVAGSSTWGSVEDVFVDAAGNIYASDMLQDVVYKIDRLAAQTIIAGTKGSIGYSGDGGQAAGSKLPRPSRPLAPPHATT